MDYLPCVKGIIPKTFIPAARTVLKDGAFTKMKDGSERGGTFLLAVRSRLFVVEDDFQVAEHSFPWATCGSGGHVAAGHLSALLGHDAEAIDDKRIEDIAAAAVASARALNAGVAGRTTTVRTVRWTQKERDLAAEIANVGQSVAPAGKPKTGAGR